VHHSALAACALAQLACASMTALPEVHQPFRPTGSVGRGTLQASFNRVQVRSRGLSLSQQRDGSWCGAFSLSGLGFEHPLDVSVGPDAIRGLGLVLIRSLPVAGTTVYEGALDGKRFRFELSAEEVRVKTERLEGTYAGPVRDPDGGALRFHAGAELVLTGEAAAVTDPPWPQLALALVAAFAATPSSEMQDL
jgi:hypothetical protein